MVNRGLKTSIWGYKDANVPVWNFAPGPTYNAFINSGDAVRLTNNLDPQPRRLGNQWATGRPQLPDGAAGHQRAGDLAPEKQLRGMWHPIHIHSEFHRVLSRNGTSPSSFVLEQDGVAKKDTVILGLNTGQNSI